jgi:hypothetical protein
MKNFSLSIYEARIVIKDNGIDLIKGRVSLILFF